MGKFEPVISRTEAAIATQFTILTNWNSRTQDPMPTITPCHITCQGLITWRLPFSDGDLNSNPSIGACIYIG